jgi:hypothetical protein
MTKKKCIEKWLTHNPVNQQVIVKLLGSAEGRLAIARSLLNPLNRRMAYLRDKFESGRCLLGYKTCLEDIANNLDNTISYLEEFLAILYKRELDRPAIKQLRSILGEAKQFKSGLPQ